MKKIKLITFLLILSLVLTSCTFTKDILWVPKIDYDETIKKLMVNEDQVTVVLVGNKYSYFLQDEKKIIYRIFLKDIKGLNIKGTNIAARGAEVEILIFFEGKVTNLSKEQSKFFASIGGRIFNEKNSITLYLPLSLKGYRNNSAYQNEEKNKFLSTDLIKNEYNAAISEKNTLSQTVGKIILTPFAVAADILLLPITIPYKIYRDHKISKGDYYCEGKFCE